MEGQPSTADAIQRSTLGEYGGSHSRQGSRSRSLNRSRANTMRPEPISIPRESRNEHKGVEDVEAEEVRDGLDTEAAQSVVGVSIGREQTRLMSPTTPAAEKSAALDHMNSWGFFDDAEEEEQEEMLRETLRNSLPPQPELEPDKDDSDSAEPAKKETTLPTIALPSPWTSTPKRFLFVDEDKFKSRSNTKSRSRAASGASILGDLSLKRLLPTGFTFPLISPRSAKDPSIEKGEQTPERSPSPSGRPVRSNTLFAGNMPWNGSISLRARSRSRSREPPQSSTSTRKQEPTHRRMISSPLPNHSPTASNETSALTTESPRRSPRTPANESRTTSPRLQRSSSHDSVPNSLLSRVSSFGDEDGRWDHIDEQVNTRLKAIKDTISDSLPSLPAINFGALRPDFTTRKEIQSPRIISTVFTASGTRSRQNSAASTVPSTPVKKEFTTSRFPILDEALDQLMGDVVILGGYRGSILRSAEPPHRQLWVPIKVGLNMRKVDMEVGLDPEDEENMEKNIYPSGMLTHIGPIDISRRLFKRMRSCRNYREGRLRVHDYGYDWRLSPELLSRKLIKYLEVLQCNGEGVPPTRRGATVIAHSLGGLITRHAVNQRPELFAGVLYAGTPQHCVNILGPFRNGDEVLLSSKVLTAQVNFTLRTSFALLPESGQCFIDKDTKEQYRVDFFNVECWKQYAFSPCISRCLPALSQTERRSLLGSLSGTLQSLSSTNVSSTNSTISAISTSTSKASSDLATKADDLLHPASHTLDMHMNSPPPAATTSTIPLPKALAYLERTLAETLRFKRALAHNVSHQEQNLYPPHAVLYSTSMPTVYGARVAGRDGIRRSDAYDNLAFASGDGVVLARAAMLPRGYKVTDGGRVRTERGHVGMLSDLEAVGRCLTAIVRGRVEGTGLGLEPSAGEEREHNHVNGAGLKERGEAVRGRTRDADGRGDGRFF